MKNKIIQLTCKLFSLFFLVFICFKLPFIILINKLKIPMALCLLAGVSASLLYSIKKFYFSPENDKGISSKEIFIVFITPFLLSLGFKLIYFCSGYVTAAADNNYLYYVYMLIPLLVSIFNDNIEGNGFKSISLYMDDNTKNTNSTSNNDSKGIATQPTETQSLGDTVRGILSSDTELRAVEKKISGLKDLLKGLKTREDIAVLVDKEGNMELDVPANMSTEKYIFLKNTVARIDSVINSQIEEHDRISEKMRQHVDAWERKVVAADRFWDLLTKRISRRTELKREFESLLDKNN